MTRSLKKGPYVDEKLENRLVSMSGSKKKKILKTWSRRSIITPNFVGHTIAVHNGNKFIPVFVSIGFCPLLSNCFGSTLLIPSGFFLFST